LVPSPIFLRATNALRKIDPPSRGGSKIVAVTGLKREARIAAGPDVRAICCGGRPEILRRELNAALNGKVRGIISFGICGALSPALRPGTCIIASEIIGEGARFATDKAWSGRLRRHLPEAATGAIAGTASILQTAQAKSELFARTGAFAADMESQTAAEFARQSDLPFVSLRAVADSAVSNLPAAALAAVTERGNIDYLAVIASLVRRPGQMGALIRTASETRAAFAALFRCLDLLGGSLPGPDFGEPALDMG
jgi:adenosylhomocysteine nucleosidase